MNSSCRRAVNRKKPTVSATVSGNDCAARPFLGLSKEIVRVKSLQASPWTTCEPRSRVSLSYERDLTATCVSFSPRGLKWVRQGVLQFRGSLTNRPQSTKDTKRKPKSHETKLFSEKVAGASRYAVLRVSGLYLDSAKLAVSRFVGRRIVDCVLSSLATSA